MDQLDTWGKSLSDMKVNEEVGLWSTVLDNREAHVETAELVTWRQEQGDMAESQPCQSPSSC